MSKQNKDLWPPNREELDKLTSELQVWLIADIYHKHSTTIYKLIRKYGLKTWDEKLRLGEKVL